MLLYSVLAVIALLAVLLKLNDAKQRKRFTNKEGKSIPGPSLLEGFAAVFKKFDFVKAQVELKQKYGPISLNFLGGIPLVSVADAELCKKILLEHRQFGKSDLFDTAFNLAFAGKNVFSTNGDEWARIRKLMHPAFVKMDDVLLDKFVLKTRETLSSFEKRMSETQGILVTDDMQRMTLDIIGLTTFNYDFGTLGRTNKMAREVEAYNFLFNYSFSIWHLLFPNFFNWSLPVNVKAKGHLKVFNELMFDMIKQSKERMAKEQAPACLLDMMVTHVDEQTQKGLTDEELRANTVIMFIAGHETTANALSFAFYVLAQRPDIQEKLCQEIMSNTKHITSDDQFSCNDVNNMQYLDNFIKETMRLYPPISQIPVRTSQKEDVFMGYTIPAKTHIGIQLYNLHHDERYWKDPNTFDPDRFLPENSQSRPFFAYIPFGAGARVCIGNNFSMLEQRVFLAMLLREYKIEFADPNYKLETVASGIVASPKNLRIKFTKRT